MLIACLQIGGTWLEGLQPPGNKSPDELSRYIVDADIVETSIKR